MACLLGHKWHGCICVRCGKAQDEQRNPSTIRSPTLSLSTVPDGKLVALMIKNRSERHETEYGIVPMSDTCLYAVGL